MSQDNQERPLFTNEAERDHFAVIGYIAAIHDGCETKIDSMLRALGVQDNDIRKLSLAKKLQQLKGRVNGDPRLAAMRERIENWIIRFSDIKERRNEEVHATHLGMAQAGERFHAVQTKRRLGRGAVIADASQLQQLAVEMRDLHHAAWWLDADVAESLCDKGADWLPEDDN